MSALTGCLYAIQEEDYDYLARHLGRLGQGVTEWLVVMAESRQIRAGRMMRRWLRERYANLPLVRAIPGGTVEVSGVVMCSVSDEERLAGMYHHYDPEIFEEKRILYGLLLCLDHPDAQSRCQSYRENTPDLVPRWTDWSLLVRAVRKRYNLDAIRKGLRHSLQSETEIPSPTLTYGWYESRWMEAYAGWSRHGPLGCGSGANSGQLETILSSLCRYATGGDRWLAGVLSGQSMITYTGCVGTSPLQIYALVYGEMVEVGRCVVFYLPDLSEGYRGEVERYLQTQPTGLEDGEMGLALPVTSEETVPQTTQLCETQIGYVPPFSESYMVTRLSGWCLTLAERRLAGQRD